MLFPLWGQVRVVGQLTNGKGQGLPFANVVFYPEENTQSPQTAVEAFFDAFHKKDSLRLASFFHTEAVLQSVGTAADGGTKLRSIPVDRFVQAVCTRPDTPIWREELGAFTVLNDPPLAVVWVPYTFYLDGEALHSGVNCFQWVRENSQWKIMSLIDTRR